MKFNNEQEFAAYFWKNPGLTYLLVDNCPGLTSLPALPSGGIRVGKLTIEIR